MSGSSPRPKPKEASSFAALLSSATHFAEPWDDSALADDVSTISYEQALRPHRRLPSREMQAVEKPSLTPKSKVARPAPRDRKSASITIRLTAEEEAQLHQRAAAAQLTVSAYLRSCIFDAENLRAQVKEALVEMQASARISSTPRDEPSRNWRTRLFARWKSGVGQLSTES